MLLLDTYPDFNWALQAGEYVLDEETKALIQSHDRDRYRPDVDELTGPVAEAIRRAGKTDQVRNVAWKLARPDSSAGVARNG